jgi:hypothetical protein
MSRPQLVAGVKRLDDVRCAKIKFMNLTVEQIEAVKSGEPVAIDMPETGKVYVLREDVYRRLIHLLQSEPEQQVFRELGMEEADRIASENPY